MMLIGSPRLQSWTSGLRTHQGRLVVSVYLINAYIMIMMMIIMIMIIMMIVIIIMMSG